MKGHLSEDRITACLAGAGEPNELCHLTDCGECARRFGEVAGPMALFRESVNELATAGRVAVKPHVGPVRPAWRRVVFAVAVALLMAAGLPVYRHEQSRVDARRRAELVAAEAQDDQLLRSVDAELSRSAPRSFERFEILMASDDESGSGKK